MPRPSGHSACQRSPADRVARPVPGCGETVSCVWHESRRRSPRMRVRALILALPMITAACSDDGPSPYDDDFPVGDEGDVLGGVPPNSSLPDDNKADAIYPAKFFLSEQSPVRNQGHRGVCSIFAATALVENLYIKAGMPNPDFSEQYMQWAVKNLSHSFPNTEGSSAQANLQMVVKFGTVEESVWPYDINPWTSANDPACTGSSQPTRCYTNGEPPAAATNARKWKLPAVRYINTNSIKAHMTAKNTGVDVGLTFFFQAWNHRLSTLPISSELWAKGVVTYPNDKDKELSLAEHEGHAILLVGWDDDAEFPMRDEQGHQINDENGNPKMEKGFWIFKNSWDTWSFGKQDPNGAGYGYLSYRYVDEYGSAVSADLPTLDTPKEICDDPGMADEDGNGLANCADPACAMSPACTGGGQMHSYTASPNAAIPDNDPTGVSSAISVSDAGALTDVSVTVDITHTYRGDLRVTLDHGGTSVVLVDGVGGSADDIKQTFSVAGLVGAELGGSWTLKVVDTAAQDTGTLNSWKLSATTH